MNTRTHAELANFIWSICNLLRGPYKRNEYRKVILPLTVLRRFDCVLAETKQAVLAADAAYTGDSANVRRQLLVGMTTPFGPTLMSTVSDFVRLTVQRKCPFGWSLMVDDAAPWHPGGPPARTYLLMVLREMPSSRAVARIESPCRRAC